MATLKELTTPLTVDEITAAIYAAIEARGVKTTSWKSGAIARTIIAGVAIVLSGFSLLQQRIAESGFLELSVGDWLTVVAKQVYGIDRVEGSFATGDVTLTNTAGGVFAPGIGDVIALNTTTGKTYRNTAAFALGAAPDSVIVPFQAIELGSNSTAAPGDIDDLETVLLGVTVANAGALVGKDIETDAELVQRALAVTGTLSPNGPSDAYRFLALSAETTDGASAGVTRVTTVADGLGNVTVYVADGDGPISGTLGDPSTPLGAVNLAIQTLAVPLAVTAAVVSATALAVVTTYEVWVRSTSGLTSTQIKDAIDLALTNFYAANPIGGSRKVAGPGFIFADAIAAAISEAVGTDDLIDLDLTVPAGDVAVVATEAPTAGVLTATVNIVAL